MKQLIELEGGKIARKIPLKKSEYTLGRGGENDIVFNTAKVSRVHATLIQEGDTYYLVDKDSTNHVFVNGEQIKVRKLASGDEISLSKTVTLLYLSDEDSEERVADLLDHLWNFINKQDFLRLKEVTNRIVSLDSLDHILEVVLEEVIKVVGAERGFIALTDSNGVIQPDSSVTHNLPIEQEQAPNLIFSHSTVQRAIQSKETIFILNIGQEEESLSNSIAELELQSVMCAPLLFGDKLVGILYVDSGYQLSEFNEMDQFFFAILSDHAAIAIENAKLYSQAQQSVQHLQEEVLDREKRYQLALEAAPDSILILRLTDGQVLQVNDAFCSIFGLSRENIAGKNVGALNLFVDAEEFTQITRAVTERQESKSVEARLQKKDGMILDVLISARRITLSNEDCMIMIATDISKQKQVEEDLKKAKHAAEEAQRTAEEANKTKDRFLASISHELRTPLNSVLGFSELLSGAENLTEKQQYYADIIQRRGTHLLTLINDILALSKVESGNMTVDVVTCDLDHLLNEVADMFHWQAEEKHLSLTFDRSPDAPRYILLDQIKLRQILTHLLSNAVKFTHQGGVTLRISARSKMKAGDPGTELTQPSRPGSHPSNTPILLSFEISDTGSGIAAEKLELLFKAFEKDNIKEDWRAGLGLGLALCQKFTHLMGGQITVASELGQGTTFTVEIPCQYRTFQENVHAPDRILQLHWSANVIPPSLALSAADITTLPSGVLTALEEAATMGDIEQVDALIATLRDKHPGLADALAEYASNFDYGKIERFIQHVKDLPS